MYYESRYNDFWYEPENVSQANVGGKQIAEKPLNESDGEKTMNEKFPGELIAENIWSDIYDISAWWYLRFQSTFCL